MSDLAATNCGCNEGGCSSIIWIILLLFFCNGNGCGSGCGNGCGNGLLNGDNSCCWIILLLLFCGCGNNSIC